MSEEILKLIELLTEKTKQRNVIWNETSVEDQFKLNFDESYVLVNKNWQGGNYSTFTFELRNKEGKILDVLDTNEQNQYNELVSNLYDNIINSYYKVEETYKSIFNKLSYSIKVGKEEDPPQKQKPTQINDDDLPF